ncbi:DNRLRE domain-containing protein [Nonomuraea fuscirosea]|uniref:DNRLRE domain-containing protein n=1 Tax=Nonomuraea fuscirosea TaxID=1291556 RepID=UPI002DDAD051|nr:DNRLRE domain-containing protein [Nonomuraea fuscirosea]WSA52689.1 DNRLRE domain-containing protein [Nonomuraea fuscirosea]
MNYLSSRARHAGRSIRPLAAILAITSAASILATSNPGPARADISPPTLQQTQLSPRAVTFPKPNDPDAPLREAVTEARRRGSAVEVLARASETSKTWAHPNGQVTVDTYAGPARAEQADGTWKWVDPSLVERDGVLEAKVPAPRVSVRFSAGGEDSPLVSLDVPGKGKLALTWPTALPRPVIKGNSAEYTEAAGPGADLVVESFASGFRFNIRLRQRPQSPPTFKLAIQAEGLDLRTDASGALVLQDANGKRLGVGGKPRMWSGDSLHRPAAARQAPVQVDVEGRDGKAELVLKPSTSFLAAPQTRFPVTVDPSVTLGLQADTWVENSDVYGDSQFGDIQLWAGGYADPFGGGYVVDRTFLTFGTSAITGRVISSATLQLHQNFLSGCGNAQSGIKAQRVTSGWDQYSLNWNAQPATTSTGEAVARDAAGCVEGQNMSWAIRDIAQAWADGAVNHGLMLRGVDEVASRPDYSRVFESAEWGGTGAPKLSVTYWLAPAPPTVSLGKVDVLRGNDAVIHDSTVGLTYTSSSAGGEDLEYSMTVGEYVNPISPPAPHVGGSGQQVTRDIALGNANSVKLAVKACLSGVSPPVCNATPAYRITSDAPDSPLTAGTDLSDPANPVLMALIARPSGKQVTGRFFLFDSTGTPVGPSPIGEGTVADAYQIALRLPDGVVQAGRTYTWKIQACVSETCSPQSAGRSFTVPRPAVTTHGNPSDHHRQGRSHDQYSEDRRGRLRRTGLPAAAEFHHRRRRGRRRTAHRLAVRRRRRASRRSSDHLRDLEPGYAHLRSHSLRQRQQDIRDHHGRGCDRHDDGRGPG